MATFGEITVFVQKRLIDPNGQAVSPEDAGAAVNEAISYWKYRRFWFNEVNDTDTLTAQNAVMPIPSDFLVPAVNDDGFYLIYSSQRYPLRKISQQTFDRIYLDNGYGMPFSYARVGQVYMTYPIPDRAYTLGRHYLKDYAALVNSEDTNDFTIYAERLIGLWATANAYELRQDSDQEDRYRAKAQDEYKNLQVMTTKSNATGRVQIYSNLI